MSETRQARYIRNRALRTAAEGSAQRRPWSIPDARVALDVSLTVPQAALRVGRTASAVESLRRRWRLGRLPDALSAHLPLPPPPVDAGDDRDE